MAQTVATSAFQFPIFQALKFPSNIFVACLRGHLRDATQNCILHGNLQDYYKFNSKKVNSNFALVKIATGIVSHREL